MAIPKPLTYEQASKELLEMTVRDIFCANLKAVKRLNGFIERERELMMQKGMKDKATMIAMDEYGFTTEEAARKKYINRRTKIHHPKPRVSKPEEKQYRDIIDSLPASAPEVVEIGWIKAHPAMARKMRQADPEADVIIMAVDLKGCPSRFAATQLQHWANNPTEFHRAVMMQAKKRLSESTLVGEEAVGMRDINELLDIIDLEVAENES